jgi:hypothetical protein
MKTLALTLAAGFCSFACSSDDARDGTRLDGGTATGGSSSHEGGSVATGGSEPAGSGGAASGDTCPSLNFNTAPLECLQDWAHAKATYPAECNHFGGFQESCDGFDVIHYTSASNELRCWYSPTTGNLIGWQSLSKAPSCGSFDPEFSAVDVKTVTCLPQGTSCDAGGG